MTSLHQSSAAPRVFGLTPKQHEAYTFIAAYLDEHGSSPSFEEVKAAVGLKSKSGAHRLITGLEERGLIRRLPNRARSMAIVGRAAA